MVAIKIVPSFHAKFLAGDYKNKMLQVAYTHAHETLRHVD